MVPATRWVKLPELVENIDEVGCSLLDSFAKELAKAAKAARKRLGESECVYACVSGNVWTCPILSGHG